LFDVGRFHRFFLLKPELVMRILPIRKGVCARRIFPLRSACVERLETRTFFSGVPDGVIVFTTNRDGNYEIYSMTPQGTNLKNLTNNSALDAIPQVSDDGTMIAFSSDRGHPGQQDVYSMNIDGSNVKNLTPNSGAFDWDPSLSPDKTKMLFMSDRAGRLDLWVVNATDGSNPVNLTTDSAYGGDFASWSDDGTKIVYGAYVGNNEEIFVMNANGSGKTRLTFTTGRDTYPAFSPDGSKIVFTSERNGNRQIYLMDSNGGNPVNLSNNPYVDQVPYFNEDGDHISFQSYRNGDGEVYIMDLTGADQTRITNHPAQDAYPSWGESAPLPVVPAISISDVSVIEGNAGQTKIATFTVSLSAAPTSPATVAWSTANGTATTVDGDFIAAAGSLSFAVGGPLSRTINVTINGDAKVEANETFFVNLTNPGNATLSDAQGVATITNDDVAAPPINPGKIIYQSSASGNNEIFLMNPDGTGNTNLTSNPANDVTPSVSRDGSIIVFASNRAATSNLDIYRMTGTGTGVTRLSSDAAVDYTPAISPDNSKIVFLSNRSGNYDIWIMGSDGTGFVNLTPNTPKSDYSPSIGLNNRVLFSSDRAGGVAQVYGINADGTGLARLTTSAGNDTSAVFSPDGNTIVFQSDRDGNREIYRMNANGTGLLRLTNNGASDQSPAFSPDGSKIVFQSYRDGNAEIYKMKTDGSGVTRLTTNSVIDSAPTWGGPVSTPASVVKFGTVRITGDLLTSRNNADFQSKESVLI